MPLWFKILLFVFVPCGLILSAYMSLPYTGYTGPKEFLQVQGSMDIEQMEKVVGRLPDKQDQYSGSGGRTWDAYTWYSPDNRFYLSIHFPSNGGAPDIMLEQDASTSHPHTWRGEHPGIYR